MCIRDRFEFIPFLIGKHSISPNNSSMWKTEDDYILDVYKLDETINHNKVLISSIDTSLKIIIGEISAQFYFFKDWDPGHKRTEPDTIRLQQIKFWSKYQ